MAKAIKCSNCGSSDLKLMSLDYAICENCKTKISLKKPAKTKIIKNEIHVNDNNLNGVKTVKKFRLEEKMSKEEFFRTEMIDLATKIDSVQNIFDTDFSDVQITYRTIDVIEVCTEINLSASVGYYRRYANGNSYTKWSAYHDKKKVYNSNSIIKNKRDYEFDERLEPLEENFAYWLRNKDAKECGDEIADEKTNYPNEYQISSSIKKCEAEAIQSCKNNIPGDSLKDFTYDCNSYVTDVKCYEIPEYTIDFDYDDSKCKIQKFGGEDQIGAYISLVYKYDNMDDEMKPMQIASLIILFLSVFLTIIYHSNYIFLMVLIGANIVWLAAYFIFRNYRYNSIIDERQKKKIRGLNRLLDEKNYELLSEEEERKIMKTNRNIPPVLSKKEKLLMALFVVLTISIFAVFIDTLCIDTRDNSYLYRRYY